MQVGLNLDIAGVESFIKARMGKVIDMDGCIGPINTFIVEPFVPHAQVAITNAKAIKNLARSL